MKWTLRNKILLGYGIVLFLTVLVFAWSFVNLLRLGRATDAILSENYRSIIAAEHMINYVERQDSGILLYLLGFEEGLQQFRENQIPFLEWLGRAKDNITIPGEEHVVASIDSTYGIFLREFTEIIRENGSELPAVDYYYERMLPTFLAIRRTSADLRDMNQETMVSASNRARLLARTALWSMSTVGLVTLLLGLVFSLVLSRRLTWPIRHMELAARQIAEGDYDVTVPTGPSDELGQLAERFNQMTSRLRAYRDLNIEQIVAEKRKSETILQQIDDGLVIIDSDLDVANINAAAARILGVEREASLGRHFLEIVKIDSLFDHVRQVIETGSGPELEGDQNFLTIDDGEEQRHYHFSIIPVYAAPKTPRNGVERVLNVILLLRDVTKFKELDRMKSEFVATASHELRTPLTSIGMSIDLLEERMSGVLDSNQRELLAVTHEEVNRLKELVNDLLDLSRIEAGKITMDLAPVPVSLLCEKAIQAVGAQPEERQVNLTLNVPEKLPPVRADANKITWVLTNLVSNALRYTDAGGHITIAAEEVGPIIHVSVEDDGIGIPHEYQPRIFDKFVQVKNDRKGGSGLGLAICKEIIRAHGGQIWVDSTPGEGSTFSFTLQTAG